MIPQSLQGNWVDLIIIIILAYYISEAWRVGFWVILIDFLGFLASLIIGLRGYSFAADLLESLFSLPHSLANAVGFLIVAGLSEAFIGFIFTDLIKKIPEKFWKKPWSNFLAIFPALGEGIVIVSFILTLTIALPITPVIKRDISSSKIGGFLVTKTQGLETRINEIFGGIIEDSLTYLTVNPNSRESIAIPSGRQELTADEASETAMFNLVNEERRKKGIAQLKWRVEVVPVARNHARDMWERGYFGHVSPEGKDVGDRLEEANITYTIAGENLALAPTLQTAHTGLMNSEGHRRNILDPEFKRMGIGVIDNGIYGKMFVQIFTD
ncbi:hypothetical protein A2962_04165 [Candidatus Woesebacteria bacterium RIFCSPLOWO2_01_FULL_39_61]|uniref:SCP domain-containing protein n=1 Tax=Candidatus Woesebacteria bacterium RIFCSPHIGHO2_02_FULL_39_13 TaxID=1802505 RepID=A0A1F7YZQ5_9BACT|nr:MAG: hypothetical protein A2692_00520 [Candidatus Woesebacteria bacterium RIFCSPHIGHO2_01_FULL_39_95]OGM32158.1 MAG: hypothetical protein A3D01_02105 [Candidatus Woesebacteria bacterium RIFCSPHIGHO2_02_FULL_39_13]OGM36607.1 MAG: hypothetical protein A3E13_02940 [Candidatus Woesebacteria bacterium RIFCSPHIGHO2_12_FULL_40_20]OGM65948.1 MAG: hypothetical protein A2962_04165 [Candidatus Woesebacteria bacterium RIFCSPLOWO2_01_FULL_39_61]OGM71410.1 MAG: hypothetical protein A3H19_04565 [Candidatus